MKLPRCKFCKAESPDFDTLRFHVSNTHGAEWQQVSYYLDVTDGKLHSIEVVAAGGMLGLKVGAGEV